MSILYSVVSNRSVPVARYAGCIGNFTEIADVILHKIDLRKHQCLTLEAENGGPYKFHYISHKFIIFLCVTATEAEMSDDDLRNHAFQFLSDLREEFDRRFPQYAIASALGQLAEPLMFNKEFERVIEALMRRRNQIISGDSSSTRITRLRGEVDAVRNIMVANIESIVERGERLELLLDKTEALSNDSVAFRRNTREVRRQMWWHSCKAQCILIVVTIVGAYGFMSAVCGGLDWPNCVGHSGGGNHTNY